MLVFFRFVIKISPQKKKKKNEQQPNTRAMTSFGDSYSYDGRTKSLFSSGNVLGQSMFEVFLLTLFVLESVGVRCSSSSSSSNRGEECEEEEESTVVTNEKDIVDADDDDDDDDASLSSLSLETRWRDFRYVLFPAIACLFHPRASAACGLCLCARRLVMEKNEKKKKKKSRKTSPRRDDDDDDNNNNNNNKNTSWLNLYRSTMLLSACSAILAIDFSQMPRRLGKTKEYGVSVMDVGVGSFIVSASCVKWQRRRKNRRSGRNSDGGKRGTEGEEEEARKKTTRAMKRAMVSFLLGFARYVSVKRSGYQLVEEEYGPMWNFFFSLAVIDILSAAIILACGNFAFTNEKTRMRHTFIVASSVAILVEVLLRGNASKNTTMKLESWLLAPTKDRGEFPTKYTDIVAFVKLNREGAFSCVGMTSLHFFGRFFGEYVHRKKCEGELRRAAWLALALWVAAYTSIEVFEIIKPSRRLCNFGYILWMITYNVSAMVVMAFIHEQYDTVPSILERANESPMLVFLFANVTTGLFNFILKDEIMRVHTFLAYALMSWHMELIHMCINVLARMKKTRHVKKKKKKTKTN